MKEGGVISSQACVFLGQAASPSQSLHPTPASARNFPVHQCVPEHVFLFNSVVLGFIFLTLSYSKERFQVSYKKNACKTTLKNIVSKGANGNISNNKKAILGKLDVVKSRSMD